jgi:S1-C subfamily serine protease
MDGDDITTAAELSLDIASHQIGDEVEIGYYRGDAQQTVTATLEEYPS